MTQRTLSGLLLITLFTVISFKALSNANRVEKLMKTANNNGISKEPVKAATAPQNAPFFPPSESKDEHGKAHTPQMDETAHIHKFHKERVKKTKKHHSKFWILGKIIVIICHLSILIIAFLHIAH